MNFKRFIGATLAVFVFFFLYEWLVHGHLLMGTYLETPKVWRNFSEMQANMHLTILYQLALAAWVTYVFSCIYPEGGIDKGLRLGIYFGVFAGILTASWYLWLPVSSSLAWSWLVSGLGEGLGAGFLLGLIYRR